MKEFKLQNVHLKINKIMRCHDLGDYTQCTVTAFDTGSTVFNNAILLHEFIEYSLLKRVGITTKEIDGFDYDESTRKGEHYRFYRKAHKIASKVEQAYVCSLGKDENRWNDYNKFLDKLFKYVRVRRNSNLKNYINHKDEL